MAQATTRPNVPVFVSSTFTDMQVYRRKIQDTLTQLEAIVRGMEQFGSKPGSPIDECLNVVQSCRLYVGVFGMRYGTVPDGHNKSMTHIEYDEAQRLGLPSLIYILNENHPIPAKDVETGPGAEKLEALKELLKKRHTVSFFTTPEDLQARIMHDVPAQLSKMGVEVETKAAYADTTIVRNAFSSTQSIKVLPPRLGGKDTLTLENVATLRQFGPYTDFSVTLLLDTPALRLPDKQTAGISIEGASVSPHAGKSYTLRLIPLSQVHQHIGGGGRNLKRGWVSSFRVP